MFKTIVNAPKAILQNHLKYDINIRLTLSIKLLTDYTFMNRQCDKYKFHAEPSSNRYQV